MSRRVWCLIASGWLALMLTACGGGTPTGTPATTPATSTVPRPTPTHPPATPTPRPTATSIPLPRVGEQGSSQTLIVTLSAEHDPVVTTATATSKPGDRLVAFDLTLASTDYQAMIYSVTYVTLRDTEAHAYAPMFTSVVPPPLFSGSLEPRESVRGWLSFAVPMDAKLATLIYDPPTGRTRITFDVSERIASPTAAP